MSELMTFPCEFSIKVMGLTTGEFEVTALSIIKKHIKTLAEDSIKMRNSKKGKYLALTVTFTATSKAQLDEIYQELSASEHILFTL